MEVGGGRKGRGEVGREGEGIKEWMEGREEVMAGDGDRSWGGRWRKEKKGG